MLLSLLLQHMQLELTVGSSCSKIVDGQSNVLLEQQQEEEEEAGRASANARVGSVCGLSVFGSQVLSACRKK